MPSDDSGDRLSHLQQLATRADDAKAAFLAFPDQTAPVSVALLWLAAEQAFREQAGCCQLDDYRLAVTMPAAVAKGDVVVFDIIDSLPNRAAEFASEREDHMAQLKSQGKAHRPTHHQPAARAALLN